MRFCNRNTLQEAMGSVTSVSSVKTARNTNEEEQRTEENGNKIYIYFFLFKNVKAFDRKLI